MNRQPSQESHHTPLQSKRVRESMARTEEVAAPANRYDEELAQAIVNSQSNYIVPGFITGMNARYKIGWVYNTESITFFQQISEGYGFVFEKDVIIAPDQSRFLPLDPVIAKLDGRTYAFITDRSCIYIDSLFEKSFSAKVYPSIEQTEIIDMVLLEEVPNRIVLRLLGSNGNIFQMTFRRDLTTSFKSVLKFESERGIMSMFPFGNSSKSKPSGVNMLIAEYSNHLATTVRLFENQISALVEKTDVRTSNVIKGRNLAATLKTWEVAFIHLNKFNMTELRVVDIKLYENGPNPLIVCLYVMYVVTDKLINIAIPKARLIRLGNQKMESVKDVEIPSYFALPSDTLDMKLFIRNKQSYVAVHIFTHKDKKFKSEIIKINEEVTSCEQKHFRDVINGLFLLATGGEKSPVTCILMLNDRFENYESARLPNLSATKERNLSHNKTQFLNDRSFNLGKRINEDSNETRQRESKEREIAFKVQLEQLFNDYLTKKISEGDVEEELRYLEEAFRNEEIAFEIKGLLYQIVDEKNRNWSVATSSEKEDLSKVEKVRQNLSAFNDLITIELKRKEKKLQKFIEFLSFNQRLINTGFIVDEYWILKEALSVMLAIRRFEQSYIKKPAIRDFIKSVITETLKKWRIDRTHLHNFDYFYSNLIGVQDFLRTSNDLLSKQSSQLGYQELLEAYRELWQDILNELNSDRRMAERQNSSLTLLFRNTSNMFNHLVSFYKQYEDSAVLSQTNDHDRSSRLIELTKYVILESSFQKSQAYSTDINFEELDHSLFSVITKCGKPKEAFLLANL